MGKEFYAQNICLTGPMALPYSFISIRNKIYFSQTMELATCILLNILEAHPGVWEMEEQGEFCVWSTGEGISNLIQGIRKQPP